MPHKSNVLLVNSWLGQLEAGEESFREQEHVVYSAEDAAHARQIYNQLLQQNSELDVAVLS